MASHPIESLMRTTMDSLKAMVDVNTVVGDPVETKTGVMVVPVSRVSFGFVAGGGDDVVELQGEDAQAGGKESEAAMAAIPFTGGSGAGVSVRPVGFLVVGTREVRFIPVDSGATLDRLLDQAPDLVRHAASLLGNREKGERERPVE